MRLTLKDLEMNPFFARTDERTYLESRARADGLTVISGRPQSGKTALLNALRENLTNGGGYLVGYVEATAESNDLLLRSVSDLYESWLKSSSHVSKARLLWEKEKGKFVTDIGLMVGELVEACSKIQEGTGSIGEQVRRVFGGLAEANKLLSSGGIELPRLSYEQGKELLQILAKLTASRIVLILDSMEQIGSIDSELASIDSYLRHRQDWPDCHFLVSVRHGDTDLGAHSKLKELVSSSALAEFWEMPKWRVEEDLLEMDALLSYLHELVPITNSMSDESLLELIDGHPGVFSRWLEGKPESEEALRQLADDAQAYRYRELDGALSQVLQDDAEGSKLAARTAMFRELTSDVEWNLYSEIVAEGTSKENCDKLRSLGVFSRERRFPSYGHNSRYGAARAWWLDRSGPGYPYAQSAVEYLFKRVLPHITSFSPDTRPYGEALFALAKPARLLNLEHSLMAVCVCPAILMTQDDDGLRRLRLEDRGLTMVEMYPDSAFLVSALLVNAIILYRKDDDTTKCEAALEKIDCIRESVGNQFRTPEIQSKALWEVMKQHMVESQIEKARTRLGKLEELNAMKETNRGIRYWFASGLFDFVNEGIDRNDSTELANTMQKLQQLHLKNLDDPKVLDFYAMAASNVLGDTAETLGFGHCHGFINDLIVAHEAGRVTDEMIEKYGQVIAWSTFHSLKNLDVCDLHKYVAIIRQLRQSYPENSKIQDLARVTEENLQR